MGRLTAASISRYMSREEEKCETRVSNFVVTVTGTVYKIPNTNGNQILRRRFSPALFVVCELK